MRSQTVLGSIQEMLRSLGEPAHPATQHFMLFQEALETATGADSIDGLTGHIAGGKDTTEATEKHLDAILISSALMFAGAEIGKALNDGLADVASAIANLDDR